MFIVKLIVLFNLVLISGLRLYPTRKEITGLIQHVPHPPLPFHINNVNHIIRNWLKAVKEDTTNESKDSQKSDKDGNNSGDATQNNSTKDDTKDKSTNNDGKGTESNDGSNQNKPSNFDIENCNNSRIFITQPLQSSLAKTVLIPLDGSVKIKWTIDPPPKKEVELSILLERRFSGVTIFPIKDHLTDVNGTYEWDVASMNDREDAPTLLTAGTYYRLFIYQSDMNYLDQPKNCSDLIAASTTVNLFQPTMLDQKFVVSNALIPSYLRNFGFGCIYLALVLGFLPIL